MAMFDQQAAGIDVITDGVIDGKIFYVESAEEVADRIRLALRHGREDRLWLMPELRDAQPAPLRRLREAAGAAQWG